MWLRRKLDVVVVEEEDIILSFGLAMMEIWTKRSLKRCS
jgi:archaeosine-15-forming tRNA-guanine transglycosylase